MNLFLIHYFLTINLKIITYFIAIFIMFYYQELKEFYSHKKKSLYSYFKKILIHYFIFADFGFKFNQI